MTAQNVVGGLEVQGEQREANVAAELPFLAIEPVLMALVLAGKGRQEAHEKLRTVALAAKAEREAGRRVQLGDMLGDAFFDAVRDQSARLSTDPKLMIGVCPSQVTFSTDVNLAMV